MDWKYLFSSTSGRISRKPYWLGLLVMFFLILVWGIGIVPIASWFAFIFIPLFIWAGYAVTIKRAHDRNRPDWYIIGYYVLSIVSGIGYRIFEVQADVPVSVPARVFAGLQVISLIWSIVLLIDLGFLRGTPGPNRHGPDPLSS
jgi:uncharacterized membrane protein YhaH (DUF805 family)